jgi:hypothetical protein
MQYGAGEPYKKITGAHGEAHLFSKKNVKRMKNILLRWIIIHYSFDIHFYISLKINPSSLWSVFLQPDIVNLQCRLNHH